MGWDLYRKELNDEVREEVAPRDAPPASEITKQYSPISKRNNEPILTLTYKKY